MSNISHFQTALATYTEGTDWKEFKKAHDFKGSDLATALEGFAREFARLPSMTERDRAQFFADRLPHIIGSVGTRRDEVAALGPVQRMLAGMTGLGLAKKEEELARLGRSLESLQATLGRLDPTTWTAESLPAGAYESVVCPCKAESEGQAMRDMTGRGHYHLGERPEELVFRDIVGQVMAQGARAELIEPALIAASQNTLNKMSIHLSKKDQFLKIASYEAYIHCDADGGMKVRIEARGELLTTEERDARRPGHEVTLLGLYNSAESVDSVCVKLYR